MVAVHRMNRPLWAILYRKVGQNNILTMNKLDKRRAKRCLFGCVDSLFDWHSICLCIAQLIRGFLLKFFPWPPLLSISIEYTITDYVDILTPKCIDKRRIIIAFNSLPPGKHCRKILLKCTTENKLCTCLELDMNMAF